MEPTKREELEQIVIGACLQNGYDQIAGIITHKTFSFSKHRIIFKAIESMYPTKPIDIITVSRSINLQGYSYYLAYCTSKLSSIANLRYHAFILLELSMRDIMIELLNNESNKELSITTKAGINEIIDECLDYSSDILDIYEKASIHLEALGSEDVVVNNVKNLRKAFDSKLRKIKQLSHVDCLFQNLERLQDKGYNTKSKLCLLKLTELIKTILITGNVDNKTATKIFNLTDFVANSNNL